MQYTIRNVPATLDRTLRKKARESGRSLNEVVIESMAIGAGVSTGSKKRPRVDWSDFVGTYVKDEGFEQALKDQDQIDPDMWK